MPSQLLWPPMKMLMFGQVSIDTSDILTIVPRFILLMEQLPSQKLLTMSLAWTTVNGICAGPMCKGEIICFFTFPYELCATSWFKVLNHKLRNSYLCVYSKDTICCFFCRNVVHDTFPNEQCTTSLFIILYYNFRNFYLCVYSNHLQLGKFCHKSNNMLFTKVNILVYSS